MSHIPPKRQRRYKENSIPPLMDMRDLAGNLKLQDAYKRRKRQRQLVPKRDLGSRHPLNRS